MYEIRFGKEGSKDVEMDIRGWYVSFRESYGESYLETEDMSEVKEEVSRLSSVGYRVVGQRLTVSVGDTGVYVGTR